MTSHSDCLFCQMSSGAFPTDMIHQDSQLFAIRDINPRAPIHVLIIPRRHYDTVRDLTLGESTLLSHIVSTANMLADQLDIGMRGYRLAFNVGEEGGQTIYHLHLHLLGGHALGPEG
jgi:histidine triad (HIT) family protein